MAMISGESREANSIACLAMMLQFSMDTTTWVARLLCQAGRAPHSFWVNDADDTEEKDPERDEDDSDRGSVVSFTRERLVSIGTL